MAGSSAAPTRATAAPTDCIASPRPIRSLKKSCGSPNPPVAETNGQRAKRLRKPIMIGGVAIIVLVAGYFYFTGGRYVSTDDAYVNAARVAISTNVPGRVVELNVHDNQRVRRGAVLF